MAKVDDADRVRATRAVSAAEDALRPVFGDGSHPVDEAPAREVAYADQD